MPPRFAYWTILIDNAPTAFRARDAQELLPTLNQLKRTNKDVALKWFARGRLWESQEQEREDFQRRKRGAPRPGDGGEAREPRGKDWRPGGEHKDPRARFDKEKQRRDKRDLRRTEDRGAKPRFEDRRPATFGGRPQGKPRFDNRRDAKPRFETRGPAKPQSTDRSRGKPRFEDRRPTNRPKPFGQGEHRGEHKGGSSRVASSRPPKNGSHRPAERRPASPRPRNEQIRNKPQGKSWGDQPRRDDRRDQPERKEQEPPPPRPDRPSDVPEPPPRPEQIVIKPEPPERG